MQKRFDGWLAMCILLGVAVMLLAGFSELGVDIQIPVISRP